jgi:hypothetical protein
VGALALIPMSERLDRWVTQLMGDGPDLETIVAASRHRDRVVMEGARVAIADKVRSFDRQAP